MIKFLKKLWEKMNEPQNERVLIILLPCIAILTAGCILAPRLFYYAGEAIRENAPIITPAPQSSDIPNAVTSISTIFVPDVVNIEAASPTPCPPLRRR